MPHEGIFFRRGLSVFRWVHSGGPRSSSFAQEETDGEGLTPNTLVLLPGLDGTGMLFGDLIGELPPTQTVNIARYPTDRFLSYAELVSCVREIIPSNPFLLVAESFSTPLAAMLAATRPPNLAGLILCAGFVTNPIGSWALLPRCWEDLVCSGFHHRG